MYFDCNQSRASMTMGEKSLSFPNRPKRCPIEVKSATQGSVLPLWWKYGQNRTECLHHLSLSFSPNIHSRQKLSSSSRSYPFKYYALFFTFFISHLTANGNRKTSKEVSGNKSAHTQFPVNLLFKCSSPVKFLLPKTLFQRCRMNQRSTAWASSSMKRTSSHHR